MQIATGEIADNPAKEYAHKGGSPENNCAATRISESRRVKHLPPVDGQRTVTLSAETPRGISRSLVAGNSKLRHYRDLTLKSRDRRFETDDGLLVEL